MLVRCSWLLGCAVEAAGKPVQFLPLGGGDGGDLVEAALEDPVGLAGGVDGAVGWGADDVAALAAGLDQHLDGAGLGSGLAGELGVPADLGAVVEPVGAAGGAGLQIAGFDAVDQGAE